MIKHGGVAELVEGAALEKQYSYKNGSRVRISAPPPTQFSIGVNP